MFVICIVIFRNYLRTAFSSSTRGWLICLCSRSKSELQNDSFTVKIGKKLAKLLPFLYQR